MKSLPVFLVLAVLSCSASTAIITPEQTENFLVIRESQFDLFENSRKVIEQLVATLRKNAQDALDAITSFSNRVQENAASIRDRIIEDFQKLRARVTDAITTVRDKLVDSGAGVRDCVESRNNDASAIFNVAFNKTMSCVNERISEIGEQMSGLRDMAHEVMVFANQTVEDMRKCTTNSDGLIATGSCLGSTAVQAELKALPFAAQSGLAIGRINLSVATLPASLEVCAGSHVVEAGLATSRILMEIGTCSAAFVFTTMSGNVEFQADAL